jgi:hypothetical protein
MMPLVHNQIALMPASTSLSATRWAAVAGTVSIHLDFARMALTISFTSDDQVAHLSPILPDLAKQQTMRFDIDPDNEHGMADILCPPPPRLTAGRQVRFNGPRRDDIPCPFAESPIEINPAICAQKFTFSWIPERSAD